MAEFPKPGPDFVALSIRTPWWDRPLADRVAVCASDFLHMAVDALGSGLQFVVYAKMAADDARYGVDWHKRSTGTFDPSLIMFDVISARSATDPEQLLDQASEYQVLADLTFEAVRPVLAWDNETEADRLAVEAHGRALVEHERQQQRERDEAAERARRDEKLAAGLDPDEDDIPF